MGFHGVYISLSLLATHLASRLADMSETVHYINGHLFSISEDKIRSKEIHVIAC